MKKWHKLQIQLGIMLLMLLDNNIYQKLILSRRYSKIY